MRLLDRVLGRKETAVPRSPSAAAGLPVCATCGRAIEALPHTIEDSILGGGGTILGGSGGLAETLYNGVICKTCKRPVCNGCWKQWDPCTECGAAMSPLFADYLR